MLNPLGNAFLPKFIHIKVVDKLCSFEKKNLHLVDGVYVSIHQETCATVKIMNEAYMLTDFLKPPFYIWCQSNGLIAKLAVYLFISQSMKMSLHKREFPIHAMTKNDFDVNFLCIFPWMIYIQNFEMAMIL